MNDIVFLSFFRSLSIIIISRLMIDKKRTCNTFCEIIKKLFEFHRVPCKTQVSFVIVWRFCLMGSWPISFNIVSRTTLRVSNWWFIVGVIYIIAIITLLSFAPFIVGLVFIINIDGSFISPHLFVGVAYMLLKWLLLICPFLTLFNFIIVAYIININNSFLLSRRGYTVTNAWFISYLPIL